MAKSAPELPLEDAGRVQSVTEFTRRVKELLEGGLRPGWVRGEVSNLRAQASGHVYFSLKDAGAQLSCVLFRGDAARQSVVLRDGLQLLVYGEISVYETRGQYQLVVRALIEHGAGRLQQELEKLKQRLAAEGLFDAERKKPVPLPKGVTAKLEGGNVAVKGPKGELKVRIVPELEAHVGEGGVTVKPRVDSDRARAMWGMQRTLINNLVVGVTQGFTEKLEISGVGYRAALQGKILNLQLGLSHDVDYEIPAGIQICLLYTSDAADE